MPNQNGIMRILTLLFIVAVVGIISFLLISSSAPFQAGLFNNIFPKQPSNAAGSIPPSCTDSLQTRINNTASGATLMLNQNCVYREAVSISKPIVLDGGGAAQIRGSDIWADSIWQQQGNTWKSSKTVPLTNNNGDNLNKGDKRCPQAECLYPQQVFLDGVKEKLVLNTTPTAGQFSVDTNYDVAPGMVTEPHIILGDNPLGHTIEVTTRKQWIVLSADNITIQNFTMMHGGCDAQCGAIQGSGNGFATIQNNDLSQTHGIAVNLPHDSKLLNNRLHHNGEMGFGSGGSPNILIQGNDISFNNTDNYNCSWECGGFKVAYKTYNIVEDSNIVHDNNGPGMWCDIDCRNVTVSNNRVYNNSGPGIFFEISNGAKIYNNYTWNNSRTPGGWIVDDGIVLSSSSNAEVYNNVAAWNGNGIAAISQNRPADNFGCDSYSCLTDPNRWSNSVGNYIYDNYIIKDTRTGFWSNVALGFVQDWSGNMFTPASNNHAANNHFWFDQNEASYTNKNTPPFAWINGVFTLANLNNTPAGGGNSNYLTTVQKDQILATHLMPTCPTCAIPLPTPTTKPTATPSPAPSQTPSPRPTPTTAACGGADINGDGKVDIFDFNILVGNFRKNGTGLQGDIDDNGVVNIFDYNILVTNFGKTGC